MDAVESQHSVRIESADVFVRSWGRTGDPAVLCWHGVGLTGRASLVFVEAGPLLAHEHGFCVHALDAPGFGRSPALRVEQYRPAVMVELVPRLMQSLGLRRVAFIGFSWGGDIGIHVAARHPQLLDALVLLDAGYVDPPLDPAEPFAARVLRQQAAARDAGAASWADAIGRRRSDAPRWTPALEQAWRSGWREVGGRLIPSVAPWIVAAIEDGMAAEPPSAIRQQFARNRIPTLLFASQSAEASDLDSFAKDVPTSEVRRTRTGHDVLAEGAPAVVHEIGTWLRRAVPEA